MRALVLIAVLLAAGCSGLPALPEVTAAEENWLLSGAGLEGVDAVPEPVPAPDTLMALTPEMERFAEHAVAGHPSALARVKALLSAIVSPGVLGLEYDQGATFTAREAFAHARANCLSFTTLFVALARHVGMDARFNEVDVPPVWDLPDSDTLVLYKHINAAVRVGHGHWKVVDIFPQEYDPSYPQRTIDDALAKAQYHNNLAMEHLLADRLPEAQRQLATAIRLSRDTSYLWGNLGALYHRVGNLKAAELALVKALEVNPRDFVAASNAAKLFEATGRKEIAAELDSLAARFQRRNPYYRYQQALRDLADGRYEAARKQVLAAIGLYDREHRFYFLLGVVYRQLGEEDLARENFDRAIALSSDSVQGQRYRRKAEMLMRATL